MKKRTIIIITILVLLTSMFAQTQKLGEKENFMNNQNLVSRSIHNNPPEWVFDTSPVSLTPNYYDYMPGGYNQTSVKMQSIDGGVYLIYHGMDLPGSTRKIWSSYISDSGELIESGTTISDYDSSEGFPSVAIDDSTGCPIVAWHGSFDADNQYEIAMSFDQYYLTLEPSLWAEPVIIFDNTYNEDIPNIGNNSYICPQIKIANSTSSDSTRIFVLLSNNNYHEDGLNFVFGYADLPNSLDEETEVFPTLDWTWATLPELGNGDDWNRAFLSLVVSADGSKVAAVGYSIGATNDSQSPIVYLNENHGEGDFTYYHTNSDGEYGDWRFFIGTEFLPPFPGTNYDLYTSYANGSHFNANFVNDDEIIFVNNMGLQTISDSWYPNYMGVKSTKFDLNTHEFSLKDITPIRYSDDGTTYLPDNTNNTPNTWWDVDEDGAFDEFIGQYASVVTEYPIGDTNSDNAYHYNHTKIAVDTEHNLVAAVWSDGTKAKLAADFPDNPDYQSWSEMPEIAIAVSDDGGETWSEPIKMNSNSEDTNQGNYTGGFVEEFSGMKPTFIYPSEKIYDVQQDEYGCVWGTIHLMFLDDYLYGSEILNNVPREGGMMNYASIRIKFTDFVSNFDDNETPTISTLKNYPNPFNPTTTINFEVPKNSKNASLEIFNIKGQSIKQFKIENNVFLSGDEGSVIWNGKDNGGNPVSSGVYFYQLNVDGEIKSTNKCLLLK